MLYSQIVHDVAAQLRQAGIEPYQYEAGVLVAHAAGIEHRELQRLVLMREVVPQSELATLQSKVQELTARRAQREPLQHILGTAAFRFLNLQVGRGVFIPRPETELVVQAGLDWLDQNFIITGAHGNAQIGRDTQITQSQTTQPLVVDLCAGSGAIGLAVVTECPQSQVWAVELESQAYAWTERNAIAIGQQYHHIHADKRYHLLQGDATDIVNLPELNRLRGHIDLVLSNPPYIPLDTPVTQPEVRDYDPDSALYGGSADGLAIPQHILISGYQLLRQGGCMVMEHDASQGEALAQFALHVGFAQVQVHQDYAGRDRFIQAIK